MESLSPQEKKNCKTRYKPRMLKKDDHFPRIPLLEQNFIEECPGKKIAKNKS